MKTVKIFIPLCAGVALSLLGVNARAADTDAPAKAEAKPEPKHELKIVRKTEEHVDHLATVLKYHATKVVDATENVTERVVGHVADAAHKVGDVAKKTSDKIGKKIDNLSE
ncbi:MAG TPA: hypothetical protein VK815_16000 [Candidatus Acidoferrales bacterium]|nr:hypothetical protein [Candidatus Acidoferrales bacterium]